MSLNIRKFLFFLFIIILNLILRIWISIQTVPCGDILVHQEWAKVLYQQGLSGSYFFDNWTYTPPTQPSLMMLAYSASRSIYENRNIFSTMHNLIKIPPAFILLGFQKYGEILSLQIWELLGTYLIAFVIFFYLSKKTSFKKSLLCFLFIIFNPISIFTNSVWGQNDILPTAFMYLSFILLFSKFIFISPPIIFFIGVLFKPTILIIFPFFIFLYINQILKHKYHQAVLKTALSILICFLIFYFSFKPFVPPHTKPLNYISSIINNRIRTSSKGLKLASVSAFNLYSLFWDIDKTYATNDESIIELKDIAIILIIFINYFFISKIHRSKRNDFNSSLFIIYFISQGTFLFMTNMLERYFFPAFLASSIIMVIYWRKFGKLMLIQQLIWFLNLIYAYYHRDVEIISYIFKSNNFIVIRLLSFLNIFIYFCIYKKFSPNININQNINHR